MPILAATVIVPSDAPGAGRLALALACAYVALAAAVAAPFWYWNGGLIEIEATAFVQQYLDDRSLLQKVFDPHANDLGTYQARELSYFFDYLDARVFEQFVARGRLVLVPASAIAASTLTIGVFLYGARVLGVPSLTAALLLLVYVTGYVHLMTMGVLYRSAKPLLAPLVMAAALGVGVLLRSGSNAGGRRLLAPAAVFVLLCAMALLDRQGFMMAVVAFGVLLFGTLLLGSRRDVAVAAGAAVALMVTYNGIIGPWLVERINGYQPDFACQRLPIASLAEPKPSRGRCGA